MSERRAASARRCATALLILAAAACRGTSDWMAGAATPEPGTEGQIVVDVRWDLGLGRVPQHGAIWLGPQAGRSEAWQQIELSDPPDAVGGAWLALCTVYRDRCCALSEQAFDALRRDSAGKLPSAEYALTYGREAHLVLPSPDLSRLIVLHWVDGRRGIFELPSLHELPWPAGIDWGAAGNNRIEADTVAGWSADGGRLALVVDDGSAPSADGTPQTPPRVLILEGGTGALAREISVSRYVEELAWGPDGKQLALLVSDHLLGARAGHTRPYGKLYVQVVDVGTGAVRETPLGDALPEVTAHIVWDPQAVSARTGWEMPQGGALSPSAARLPAAAPP